MVGDVGAAADAGTGATAGVRGHAADAPEAAFDASVGVGEAGDWLDEVCGALGVLTGVGGALDGAVGALAA